MSRAASTGKPVELTEDGVPVDGIGETVAEVVEIYGGEVKESGERESRFTLPLRRGVASSGSVECTLTWATAETGSATLTLRCDRDVDAPKAQRVAMLVAGVIGSFLFMLWPFFPHQKEWGTLAWLGGAIAIAVYLMTLRRTSGGLAYDFLQRVARRQREHVA